MKTDFYQQAISDPHSQCPEFLAALANDPALQELQQSQIQQDDSLLDFFNTAPEPSSAHVNAVNEIVNSEPAKRWSAFNYLAVAASLVLCVLSLKYIDLDNTSYNHQLASHALNHTAHGHSYAGVTNIHPSVRQVNFQLAAYGASIRQSDNLIWNKDCDFEGVSSAHLVYQDNQARINVYLVPDHYEFSQIESVFQDERYQGTIKKVANNYLVIVGPKGHDLNAISQRIDQDIQWSI